MFLIAKCMKCIKCGSPHGRSGFLGFSLEIDDNIHVRFNTDSQTISVSKIPINVIIVLSNPLEGRVLSCLKVWVYENRPWPKPKKLISIIAFCSKFRCIFKILIYILY